MVKNEIKIYLAGEMSKDPHIIAKWRKDLANQIYSSLDCNIVAKAHRGMDNINLKGQGDFSIELLCPEGNGCDHTGIDPFETVSYDMKAIEDCDVVVAFLNRSELYGTIVELCHAARFSKPILVMIDENYAKKFEVYEKSVGYDVLDVPKITQTNHSCNCMFQVDSGGNDYWFLLHYMSIFENQDVRIFKSNNFEPVKSFLIEKLGLVDRGIFEKDKVALEKDLELLKDEDSSYEKSIVINKFKRDYFLVKRLKNNYCSCQLCDFSFKKKDGKDYVEIHHIVELSKGGKDAEINTLVVCANCHRKLHYAKVDLSKFKEGIIIINGEEISIKR